MNNRRLRRCVSLGVLLTVTLLAWVVSPLALFFLVVCDILQRRRMSLSRAYVLLLFYGLWEIMGVAGAFLVWLCSGIWTGRNRDRFLAWNYALQRFWTQGFAWVGLRLFSLSVHDEETGHPFGERPILLLVRHTSLADTILTTYLMRVQRNFKLRYVMKRELLWDPCLDIVGNRLPNYFVDRASANTRQETESIAALAEFLKTGEGVILWPESTRFSPAKRERALERLRDRGDTELLDIAYRMSHVLPPRLGGVLALLERNPEMDVFFCAHAGFENAASFREFFNGAMIGREIRAKLWGFPAQEVPRDLHERKLWLYRNWCLVDDFVRNACAAEEETILERKDSLS